MDTKTGTFDILSIALQEQDPQCARLRFGAVVRTLGRIGAARAGSQQVVPMELDDALPTRRINRMRRLLGKLPKPGKSRNYTRRLR